MSAYDDLGGHKPKLTRAEIEALIASVRPAPDEQATAEAIAHKRESMRKMDAFYAPLFISPIEGVMISRELARKLGHPEQLEEIDG